MTKEKRLIFTVTPGRSGTFYLTRLLQGLPDIHAEHEPLPGFHEWLPQARHDPEMAKRFLVEKKIPYIHSFPESAYIETSHYFCKGFIEPLLSLGVVPDLIMLKRDARKVASSWFLLGVKTIFVHKQRLHPHILGPHEPNCLPASGWEHWNDYQLCYWYALENFLRMRHYTSLITLHGGKILEADLPLLSSEDGCRQLLAWVGVPEDKIAMRIKTKKHQQTKINEKLEVKADKGLQAALADMDLNALEAQVRMDCGYALERKM